MGIFLRTCFFAMISALLLFSFSCSKVQKNRNDKITAVAGLPPVANLASIIAGSKIEVLSLLPAGRTPHDFSPKPSDIKSVSKAKIFFSSGMPFEKKSAAFLQKQMPVSDISAGIKKLPLSDHTPDDQCGHQHHAHGDSYDPHIWLSPANLLIISENICNAFEKIDPENAAYYRSNTLLLKQKISETDKYIRKALFPHAGKTFFIYHPSLGYFAKEYALKQRAVELNGREVSAVQLADLIREAKKEKASVIFVQQEFNPNTSRAIAKQINGKVTSINPLQMDVLLFMRQITDDLVDGFTKK